MLRRSMLKRYRGSSFVRCGQTQTGMETSTTEAEVVAWSGGLRRDSFSLEPISLIHLYLGR
jgi:hypothetical protein